MVFDFLKKENGLNEEHEDAHKKKKLERKHHRELHDELDEDFEMDRNSGRFKTSKNGNVDFDIVAEPIGGTGIKSVSIMDKQKHDFEKINAKIRAINDWIIQFYERFSYVSESLESVRKTSIGNEKEISKLFSEIERAIKIAEDVKTEESEYNYKKMEIKISELAEKIEASKHFSESIMDEIKDLRKKIGVFVGTDVLANLSEDMKKDLIEMHEISGRVRANADKSEQIFIELKKGFINTDRVNKVMTNLENSYLDLKKQTEKLMIHYNIINQDEFKEALESGASVVGKSSSKLEDNKGNNKRMIQLMEAMLSVARKNKEDIENIAATIGDNKIKRISDYESRLSHILRIMEKIVIEINEIEKRTGIDVRGSVINKYAKKTRTKYKKTSKAGKKLKEKQRKPKRKRVEEKTSKRKKREKPKVKTEETKKREKSSEKSKKEMKKLRETIKEEVRQEIEREKLEKKGDEREMRRLKESLIEKEEKETKKEINQEKKKEGFIQKILKTVRGSKEEEREPLRELKKEIGRLEEEF